jgi:hypothetical protein
MIIIIIIIIAIILVLLYFIFRRTKESIENIIDKKYDIYKNIIEKSININELIIADKTYMKKRKLNEEEINKIIYYLFVPDNNMNKNIKYIVYEYLDFIQKPDLIKGNDEISNYNMFLKMIHDITGKDSIDILNNSKKDFLLDLIK